MTTMKTNIKRLGLTALVSLSLTACGTMDRLSNIGQAPQMAKMENPQLKEGYQPVSMPMPAPQQAYKQPNSLWASNRKNFFKDQRAGEVGDILTVMVSISDEATLDNETERKRNASEDADITNLLGYESNLADVLPQAVNPGSLVGLGNTSNHTGEGSIEREEEIEVRLAAVITQKLPNGNLVISGHQEVRVNFEKRILRVDGIIRPEDISTENTVSSDQIAEARIIYGGEGQITDVQQPRYGQQVYDVLFPF